MFRALLVLLLASSLYADEKNRPKTAVDETRATITKALPYIQEHGVQWMEQRQCVTCHHSTFMVWSLNASTAKGFTVDAKKLAGWNEWVRNVRNIQGKDAKDKDEPAAKIYLRNSDTVGQLLLGRTSSATDAERRWLTEIQGHMLAAQQPEGHWKAGGQLPGQKRPARETDETSTMWIIYTLTATGAKDDTATKAIAKANEWLKDAKPGVSAEWWAVKLLEARQRGQTTDADAARKKLLESQRNDGGWGWLLADDSDALGTGLALYALVRDGVARDDAAITKAKDFLRKTQADDGSWAVHGTKTAKRDRIEPTATYWGTCWAVIALVEALPVERK